MPNPQNNAQRRRKAQEVTERSTIYAAGAGLTPVPIVDVAVLSRVQVVLIRDICQVCEVNFKEHRLRTRVYYRIRGVAGSE